jgi:UBX domain-containing protein 1
VLGSEDIPSAFIPDPRAPPPSTGQDGEGAVAVREITLWREGFSIHGGPLMGYDDPENEAILEAINSGWVLSASV